MSQPGDQAAALRPEVLRIIQTGRREESAVAGRPRAALLLALLTAGLLWACFTPLECAPLGWIALVPLLQLARAVALPRRTTPLLWFAGFLGSLAMLQWMRLGHPAMYLALAALAGYLACYFPAFIWMVRRTNSRGLPLWLAAPICWTALEYLRSWLFTGFSWYYLGHSQYEWTSLIQISDVTGAWGLSFLMAWFAGLVAELVPSSWVQRLGLALSEARPRPKPAAWSAFAGVFAVCWGYGLVRQSPPESFPAGPVVALIQGHFPPELKQDRELILTRYRVHNALTQQTVELQPDLVVWPETMFPWPERSAAEGVTDEQILAQLPLDVVRDFGSETSLLIEEFRSREVQQSLASHSQGTGAALMIGLEAVVAEADKTRIYNSAAFIRPDLGYVGRYDKIHRVIFGEYIPLRDLFPWLSSLTPFGAGFGIDAGRDVALFKYRNWQLVPLICFEDTVPRLVRKMASRRDSDGQSGDLLVNLTNDAWFRGSSELDQHLITAAFRCVENRIPMVRAVNGGISAFIDGDGRIREPAAIRIMQEPYEGLVPELSDAQSLRDPETGRWRRNFAGIILGQVPLDPRTSIYLQYGDWFPILCSVLAMVGLLWRQRGPENVFTGSSCRSAEADPVGMSLVSE
ncbi:MAG: Apolipoprotein N-acyltransferase [Planctomycetota bacterium]|jgi:apolipoprotein N-acyltransferase